jgi:hypothetical protein
MLVPNPAEQAVLRRIIGRYEAGVSFRSIARELNAAAVPTKHGTSIVHKGVLKPLSGLWHGATVKSVIEHADLADDLPE